MSAVLGSIVKERVLDGTIDSLRASRLVFRLDKTNTRALLRNQATFTVYITDDEGNSLVELWSGAISEDCTMTIMDFDEAFKINIT